MINITFDTISIIILIGVLQGVILATVLAFNYCENRRQETLLLSLLLGVSAYTIFYGILLPTNLFRYLPHLIRSGIPLQFLIGPFYYSYTQSLIQGRVTFKPRHLVHLIPAVFILAVMLPFYLTSGAAKIEYIDTLFAVGRANPRGMVIWMLFLVHLLCYLFVSFGAVRKYEKRIRENCSNIEKITLGWFSYLILSVVVTFISLVAITILYHAGIVPFDLNRLIPLIVSLFIYGLSYRVMLRPHVYYQPAVRQEGRTKYSTSALTDDRAGYLQIKLMLLVENEELYLEPDLTLGDLAEKMGEKSALLSQLFSQKMETSFYEFINGFRAERVMRKMKEGSYANYTLLDLAFDAGFNSKASFNSFFKKYTGMTPSAYRKGITNNPGA